MLEAIRRRTNELDDDSILRMFEAAFSSQQALTPLSAESQFPAAKKYIRSSALPSQLAEKVEQIYEDVLDGGEFVFVTIHPDIRNLRRRVGNKALPTPRLGKRLIELLDDGCPIELAYEDIFKNFFGCLERELQCYVRSVRVYENDGKRYNENSPVTHVHMCIPLPKGRSYFRFVNVFTGLYHSLVCPAQIPLEALHTAVTTTRTIEDLKHHPRQIQVKQDLNFKAGRFDDELSHPAYLTKQIINEAVLLSRVFASKAAKHMKGGTY